MKNDYILLLFFIINSTLFAQQMPIDFSDNSDVFNVFGGSTFTISPSPDDASNPTGQFFRSDNSGEQGFFIDLTQPINLDEEDEITLRFYAFDPNNHTIVIKLENGTNPDIEVSQSTTSNNMWTNLIFDFATVSGSGTYSRLTIRIDDGSSTPGAFRIDDINDGSVAGNENEIDIEYTDLVWSDEFNGTELDMSKWYRQTFGPNGGQWFNGELQHYTDSDDNSFVSNGELHIVAKKETTTQNGVTLDYTSARLNSKYAFTYGRVDVRAKLPEGNGTWPAIWTLGKNISETGTYWETQGFGTTSWPQCGELDIMEHGLHATDVISSAIHTPSSFGNTMNTDTFPLPDVSANYHVYSMNWSPDQITFLVDGVGFYTYNPAVKDSSTWPFDLDQFLLLNVAMGGFAGNPDPNFTQSSMVIDYVRVYQNELGNDEFVENNLKIYPNPARNLIHIEGDININQVDIYTLAGKVALSVEDNFENINISNLNSGMYIIKIQTSQGFKSEKIIIE